MPSLLLSKYSAYIFPAWIISSSEVPLVAKTFSPKISSSLEKILDKDESDIFFIVKVGAEELIKRYFDY